MLGWVGVLHRLGEAYGLGLELGVVAVVVELGHRRPQVAALLRTIRLAPMGRSLRAQISAQARCKNACRISARRS